METTSQEGLWYEISLRSRIPKLALFCWIIAVETIKILYIVTCDCRAVGQPFNSWFFPAFQHAPYTFWWTYHGITWLAGPYSLAWWGLNSPAFLGYWVFFGYLLLVDLIVFLVLFRQGPRLFAIYYLTISLWFVTVDPVDFFPILFAVAGRYRWYLLLLAPAVKLPFGAPGWVWTWAFTSSNSLQGPENYSRYLILGAVWVSSLCLYLRTRCSGLKSRKEKQGSKVANNRVTSVEGRHSLRVLGTPSDESLTSLSFHSQDPQQDADNLTRPIPLFSLEG